MKLLTSAILKKLPRLGMTSEMDSKDVKVILKAFNPSGSGTWYITEYDPSTGEAFGYANVSGSDCAELGYINMNELQNYRGRFGLGIERDIHFGFNHTLKEVMDSRGTI
jgi:hypothetical protein